MRLQTGSSQYSFLKSIVENSAQTLFETLTTKRASETRAGRTLAAPNNQRTAIRASALEDEDNFTPDVVKKALEDMITGITPQNRPATSQKVRVSRMSQADGYENRNVLSTDHSYERQNTTKQQKKKKKKES